MPAAQSDDIEALTLATNRQTMVIALVEVLDHMGPNHNRHHELMDILRGIYNKVAAEAGEPAVPSPT